MPKTKKNQRGAERRRAEKRKLTKKLGIEPGIIRRHEERMGPTKTIETIKKNKPPPVVYQVVLLRGPNYGFQMSSWVETIMRWCDKTERQAESIIERAEAYHCRTPWEKGNPPVIVSTTSMSEAERHRINLRESISSTVLKVVKKSLEEEVA